MARHDQAAHELVGGAPVTVAVISLVVGLVLLVTGAELLVRGASGLAASWGVPPIVVGLTVVAYGTSAPEMAVSAAAAASGRGDLAIGNALGSNVFNVLAILGIAALVTPLLAASRLVRVDVPLVVLATAVVWWMAADGALSRLDGVLLIAAAVLYTIAAFAQALRAGPDDPAGRQAVVAEATAQPGSVRPLLSVAYVVAGLVLLVLGSRGLVSGATFLARAFGLPELIIGLTVVAAGTSLPELGTSVLAALRGQRDLAVGNVVGSNLFNLTAVLGLGATVAPAGLPVAAGVVRFDLPVAFAAALVCLPIVFTGGRIARWEGGLLFAFYGAYVAWLFLNAARHVAAPDFGVAMVGFVLPIVALGLLAHVVVEFRRRRRS